jgi:hypothetical protein
MSKRDQAGEPITVVVIRIGSIRHGVGNAAPMFLRVLRGRGAPGGPVR